MHLYFYFTYNSSALVGSTFGAIWEDPEGGFIKFAVKRASKQDQTLHIDGKPNVILYFREECIFNFTDPTWCHQLQSRYHQWPQHMPCVFCWSMAVPLSIAEILDYKLGPLNDRIEK